MVKLAGMQAGKWTKNQIGHFIEKVNNIIGLLFSIGFDVRCTKTFPLRCFLLCAWYFYDVVNKGNYSIAWISARHQVNHALLLVEKPIVVKQGLIEKKQTVKQGNVNKQRGTRILGIINRNQQARLPVPADILANI